MAFIKNKSLIIDLVGATPTGNDNLGLSYVAAALKNAGFEPRIHLYRHSEEMIQISEKLATSSSGLLGVAISSGEASLSALTLVLLLRKKGYTGHICCGGTYATLARKHLISRYPQIDSIVRHDGEVPVVHLARAVAHGEPFDNLPGITTRNGDGLPAPVADCSYQNVIPLRDKPKRWAGVLSAKISAVRGCFGSCIYCGLNGLRKEAVKEAKQCGLDTAAISKAGIGRMRRRSTESVAAEMAKLYHEEGVRYFHFVDENHLPANSAQAAAAIDELAQALNAKGVTNRAVCLMLRSDAVTEEVASALDRLGVVRCLLGVESNNAQNLSTLKRHHTQQQNINAMRLLKQKGITFHFNLLIVHHRSDIEQIDREIAALNSVFGGLIDLFQLTVYEGTTLFEELKKENRLQGGPLIWHFWPEEKAARKFSEIFYLLRRDATGFRHLTSYAYEAIGAYSLSKRLGHIKRNHLFLEATIRKLIEAHNQLWISLARQMSAMAKSDASPQTITEFIQSTQVDSAKLILKFKHLNEAIQKAASHRIISDIFYQTTAAAASVAMGILGLASCSQSSTVGDDTDTTQIVNTDETDTETATPSTDGTDSETGDSQETDTETPDTETTTQDTETTDTEDTDTGDTDSATAEDTDSDTGTDSDDCTEEIADDESCSILEQGDNECEHSVHGSVIAFELNAEGKVINVIREDGGIVNPDAVDCYIEAVADQRFPCLAEFQPIWHDLIILLS